MKKFLILSAATMLALPALAQETADNDSTDNGFKFTDIVLVKDTPVKDQNKSGTCWSFSGMGLVEDEILRKGGPELDLSEMFVVRHCYEDKADKFIRMDGFLNFAQGGAMSDVFYVIKNYGLVPESVYDGLNYGEEKHSHYEMFDGLNGYLRGVLANTKKQLTTGWKPGLNGILDAYLGQLPETFEYNGKTYTPRSFADELGINPDDYVSITSFTHHPFYTWFPIEVADNWTWAESYNVPLDEMKSIVDNALANGYPVGWAADVSEPGFKWYEGYAVLPADLDEANMTDAEISRWTKLSDRDRQAERDKVKGPGKEKTVTQESRQKEFENKATTDDHGMVLVGIAEDQEGNRYYKVKNSWDTNQIYDGYFYVSEPFFLAKTINYMLHKDALPKDLQKKMKR